MIESKVCVVCGKTFSRPGKISAKQWAERSFCSKRCAALKRDVGKDVVICEMYKDGKSCDEIGICFGMSGTNVQRILKENGIEIDQYKVKKGGLSITDNGYLRFNQTKANGKNAGRRLHDIIAEMVIGRKLKPVEVVHHKDGNKMNNSPSNLQVMTRGEHTRLHKRQKEATW